MVILTARFADAIGVPAIVFTGIAAVGFFVDLFGDGDDFHLGWVTADQVEFIDHGVEAVVV
ncbi:hypothetical protein D3C84_1318410 [compost metagenome]